MDNVLIIAGLISMLVSAYFAFQLWRSQRSTTEKIGCSVLLAVPIAGPFLYLFITNDVPRQPSVLADYGPRGTYTSRMIALRRSLDVEGHSDADASSHTADPSGRKGTHLAANETKGEAKEAD